MKPPADQTSGDTRDDTEAGLRQQLGWQALELWVASSFAVAQPLLSLLGANATFFTAHQMSGAALVWFALGLLFALPLVLTVIEVAVAAVSRRVSASVHNVLIGALIAATLAPPIARALGLNAALWLGLAGVITVGGAVAFQRLQVLRTVVRALAFAPALFLFTFAVLSPASELITGTDPVADVAVVEVAELPPVVWLILDQFPMPFIIDEHGEIVEERHPNLARLAQRSTWYPNATAAVARTSLSVPAALTGMWPEWGQLPVASQHPLNLFTILGRDAASEKRDTGSEEATYDIRTEEYVTQLCPDSICDPSERADSTMRDTFAIYIRYLLPESTADRFVPRIDDRWDGFGTEATNSRELHQDRMAADENRVRFDRFLEPLSDPDLRGLHYAHLFLPHEPLHYLPDGRIFPVANPITPDDEGVWPDDEAAMAVRLQRYVSQTMFADRLIGELIDELDDAGTFDDTLIVVMSDHGASTRPGMVNKEVDDRRSSMDTAPIPLFIKAPGQRGPVVDDRVAQQIDVLPTVLELAGVDTSGFGFDGVPLTDAHRDLWSQRKPQMLTEDGVEDFVPLPAAVDSPTIQWIAELFPTPADPYRVGPHATRVGTVHTGSPDQSPDQSPELRVTLDDPDAFADVSIDAPTIPANVSGVMQGGAAGTPVAVVVNGTIAGVGRTFVTDAHRFSVLVDPGYFVAGANEVTVLRLGTDGDTVIPVDRHG